MSNEKFPVSRRRFMEGTAAGAAVAAATTTGPAFAQSSDSLRVRNYSDIQILDPAYILSAPETDVNLCTMHGLVTIKSGDEWDWQLDAASEIDQVDETHINFTMRDDIGWSNGFGEMTAHDVKFSYERVADPEMASPYSEDWIALDHVEVNDDRTGTIVLTEPYAPLWTTTMPSGRGMIVCKDAVEALDGKRYEAEPPAVSGPYEISKWSPSQKLTLSAIEGYTGPNANPDFKTIEIYPIVDEQAAEVGFLAGDLDITTVPVTSLLTLRDAMPEGASLIEHPSLKYVWMGINQDNELFSDIRLRRAAQYAVNVNQIIEAAYFGVAEPSTGIIPPGLVGHRDKPIVPYEGDPEFARQLMEEAGVGGGFSCRIDTLNKSSYTAACQVIQSNLADVGIEADINVHDPGVWWTMGDETAGEDWKELQIMYNRFSSNPDPGWYSMWFTPQQVGIWNWERFNNVDFGMLHAEALVTMAPEVRNEMYIEMQDLMEESGCYRFITHELTPTLYRDTIIPALGPDGRYLLKEFKMA
jgi:peptide/nickel transport system substrate-binding protein